MEWTVEPLGAHTTNPSQLSGRQLVCSMLRVMLCSQNLRCSLLQVKCTSSPSPSLNHFLNVLYATDSSTLAWKIPWTEELGRLQSVGLLGVRHD